MSVKSLVREAGIKKGDTIAVVNCAGSRFVGEFLGFDNVFGYMKMPGNKRFHFAHDAKVSLADGEKHTKWAGTQECDRSELIFPRSSSSVSEDVHDAGNCQDMLFDKNSERVNRNIRPAEYSEEMKKIIVENQFRNISMKKIAAEYGIKHSSFRRCMLYAKECGDILVDSYSKKRSFFERFIHGDKEMVGKADMIIRLRSEGNNLKQIANRVKMDYQSLRNFFYEMKDSKIC